MSWVLHQSLFVEALISGAGTRLQVDLPGLAVAGLDQDLAVDGEAQRLDHVEVGQERVRVRGGRALLAERRVRVGLVDLIRSTSVPKAEITSPRPAACIWARISGSTWGFQA